MNTPEKIHPEHSPDHSTRSTEGGISNRNEAVIHDRTGLYISIIALVLSAVSMGGVFMYQAMMGDLIAAKIEAGSAKAAATAEEARTHARVALDKVEDFRAKLAEKGINVKLDGH